MSSMARRLSGIGGIALCVLAIGGDVAAAQAAKRNAATTPQRQIACTRQGCMPVPPGCTPRYQMGREGYSGFDEIICR